MISILMLDRYISGDVDRISPEALVSIVDVKERAKTFGGAIILPGIVLSKGCLVGIGATVIKDISFGIQAIGVSAKICDERR